MHSIMNWYDPDIRMAAHRMLSVSVAIFCAMSLFKMIEGFVFIQLIPSDPPRGLGIKDLSHEAHLGIELVMFCFFLAAISWCCRCTCKAELGTWFNVSKLIVPHIAGFCGFALSGDFIEVMIHKLGDNLTYEYVLVVSILALVIFIRLLCWAMHIWRRRPHYQSMVDGENPWGGEAPQITQAQRKRDADRALEQCTEAIEEGEDEVTAFVLSGALYGFVRYLILSRPGVGCGDHAAAFQIVPGKFPETCVPHALVNAWIYYSWPAVAALVFTTCPCWGTEHGLLHRVARFLSVSSGLLICRLILALVVQWFFWQTDSEVTVYMGAALFTTTLAVVLTFLFDFLADLIESKGIQSAAPSRSTAGESASDAEAKQPLSSTSAVRRKLSRMATGLATGSEDVGQYLAASTRSLMSVFGLLVGLSWEGVFEAGEDVMVEFVNHEMVRRGWWHHPHAVLLEMAFIVAVLACVVPGWAKHLVPAAEKDRAYHQGCIERESESRSLDMFTPSVLRRLALSCIAWLPTAQQPC